MAENGFYKGYYIDRFVYVPSKETSKEEIIQFKKKLKRCDHDPINEVLDLKSVPYNSLKKFCEITNIPINWIIDSKEAPNKEDLPNIPLSEVIEIFLSICSSNTEKTYRYSMDILGDLNGLFDLNQKTAVFLSSESEIKKILEDSFYKRDKGFLQALFKFIKGMGATQITEKNEKRNTRRTNPKIKPLTKKEFKRFIVQLQQLNQQYALIAEIIWFVNNEFLESGEFITLESVLKVTKHDIHPEVKMIDFSREGNLLSHFTSIELPADLFNRILENAKDNTPFVFSKKDGGLLKGEQVNNSFRKAGKLAGINRTPKLRRTLNNDSARKKLDKL